MHQLLLLLAQVDGLLARGMAKVITQGRLAGLACQPLHHEGNLLGNRGRILVPVDGLALHVELHLGLYAVGLDQVLPIVLNDLLLELLLAHARGQLLGLGCHHRVLVVHHVGWGGLQRRLHAGLALLLLLEVLAEQLILADSLEGLLRPGMALALIHEQAVRLLGGVLTLHFVGLARSESPPLGLRGLSCLRGGLEVLGEVQSLLVLAGQGVRALLASSGGQDAARLVLVAEADRKVLELLVDGCLRLLILALKRLLLVLYEHVLVDELAQLLPRQVLEGVPMVLLLAGAPRVVEIDVDVNVTVVDEDRALVTARALVRLEGASQVRMADRELLRRGRIRPRLARATSTGRKDHTARPLVPEPLHVPVEETQGPERLLGLLSLRQ